MAFSSIMRVGALAGALFFSTTARSVDGDLDPSFGDAGVVWTGAQAVYGAPVLALQGDGRILVCDVVRQTKTGLDLRVARFNENGSPDVTFGSGGAVIQPLDDESANEHCNAIAVQSNGRIVLAGSRVFEDVPLDFWAFVVVRLMPDGALDSSFGEGRGFIAGADSIDFGVAEAVTVDSQHRIVVAGGTSPGDPKGAFAVARLETDGSFDETFNGNGQRAIEFPGEPSYGRANGLAIDSRNRIVLAGGSNNLSGLARLLTDGTLDATFGDEGKVVSDRMGPAQGFMIDHAGRYVIAGGTVSNGDNTNEDVKIARLLTDGSFDAAFGVSGVSTVGIDLIDNGADSASDVLEQPDGKVVAVGYATYGGPDDYYPTDAMAVRVDANGRIDPTFGIGGRSTFSFGPSPPFTQTLRRAALDPAGRVLAVGYAWAPSFLDDMIIRLARDGLFANGFDADGKGENRHANRR